MPTGENEVSIEDLMKEIEERRKNLAPKAEDDVPADAYPNYYWECIGENGGLSGHPIYRHVLRAGGSPVCPVCGSQQAWERGRENPTPPAITAP